MVVFLFSLLLVFCPFCSQPVYFWVLLLSIYCCFLSIKKKKELKGNLTSLQAPSR